MGSRDTAIPSKGGGDSDSTDDRRNDSDDLWPSAPFQCDHLPVLGGRHSLCHIRAGALAACTPGPLIADGNLRGEWDLCRRRDRGGQTYADLSIRNADGAANFGIYSSRNPNYDPDTFNPIYSDFVRAATERFGPATDHP